MDTARGGGVQVIDGRGVETPVLSRLVATAFLHLAPCADLVPDEADRYAVMERFFRLEVEAAKQAGRVRVTGDLQAVALWVPRTGEPVGLPEMTDELLEAVGEYAPNFLHFERELAAHYPTGRAFVHLTELAVHPDVQGCGLGSAQLDDAHAELDEQGMPAYLEAANRKLAGYYKQFGYEPYGEEIVLPAGSEMVPMVREPRRR